METEIKNVSEEAVKYLEIKTAIMCKEVVEIDIEKVTNETAKYVKTERENGIEEVAK